MTFWIDAQLPPVLAAWLSQTHGVTATSLKELGLRDASDEEIFQAARRADAIIISKDSDFVDLVSRHGAPPQLLWVTCGNLTNRGLQAVFRKTFTEAVALFSAGQSIVEIG
jgi:predicted nuclease of predicted toxin-antitoxin system